MQQRHPARTMKRQRGVTSLFVTMVVLLVVMLLGVTAAFLSSTQFKLAGNLQLENAAFNLAEGASNQAQAWLISNNNWKSAAFTTYSAATPWIYPLNLALAPPMPCYPSGIVSTPLGTSGTSQCGKPSDGWETKIDWENTSTPVACGVQPDGTCGAFAFGEPNRSYYIIQKIASCQRTIDNDPSIGAHRKTADMRADLFRITARGTAAKSTVKYVQTVYTIAISSDDIQKTFYCTPT